MSRTRKNRCIALLLLAAVLCTVVCSTLFLAQEGNHVCEGKGCPVCLQISTVRDLLSKLGLACLAVLAALVLRGGYAPIREGCAKLRQAVTLVSLDVKLSD